MAFTIVGGGAPGPVLLRPAAPGGGKATPSAAVLAVAAASEIFPKPGYRGHGVAACAAVAAIMAKRQGWRTRGSSRSLRTRCRSTRSSVSIAPETEAARAARIPRQPLSGPAVVITGASEGIGRATAKAFAAAGYHVVMAARSEDTLEAAAAYTRSSLKLGRQVVVVPCDITSSDDLASLHATAYEHFRDVRAVICNAGVCMTGNFMQHSMEDFETQMQVNFMGHVATARAFLPKFLEMAADVGGGGRPQKPTICFVNSFGGRVPLPSMSAYCASKFALQGFADTLRIEMEPQGVRVVTVHPGIVRSDYLKRAQWRGQQGEAREKMMSEMMGGSGPSAGLPQSVGEVAQGVLATVEGSGFETVVGLPYKALIGVHGVAKSLGVV